MCAMGPRAFMVCVELDLWGVAVYMSHVEGIVVMWVMIKLGYNNSRCESC